MCGRNSVPTVKWHSVLGTSAILTATAVSFTGRRWAPDGWCEWTAESFIYDKANDLNEPVGALIDQAVSDSRGTLWWGDLADVDLSAPRERFI